MNKANECTCPSGDGSLVHPCPAHPAVEQVGGDERAAFELFVRKHCGMPAHIAVNWDAKFTNDAWAGWQARAALAQPSPMRCLACGGYHGNSGLPCPNMRVTAQAQPSPTPHPASELDFSRPLETENGDPVKWICADVIEYKSARVCVAKDTGLVYSSPYIGLKIRNVMPEQAEAERPEGPTEDELEAAGLGYPLHKEEAVKLWYSGFRSEVITVLEAWEAIGHDIGMNPDKGELLDSLRYMLEKCEAHDAALAEVAGLRSLLNSLLCYVERDIDRMRSDRDKSDNKEIYDRSISLAMERLKAAQNAVFTTEPGCDTAVELAAQTTQAQHSVPGDIMRDAQRYRWLRDQQFYFSFSTENSDAGISSCTAGMSSRFKNLSWVDAAIDSAIAAAPGTEVPQAWLDVQAERRRQVTAEGWTPEHDDLYCAAELPRAAAAYILNGANDEAPAIWPFSAKWWKPRDARSNYVRASALILAEIERLDRAAPGKEGL
ncbi:hypothetical protein [Pseudomonas aeruginosa]|uniref:hypothetical protein n=1 Tax=Pseudomonas aeruginosa TaxID=287 RepID=UPI00223282CC|nr:hypothetical protein [Pseudomonas aeruginosa]MCW3875232.1 hypothetical protein [Pseudomonas aeruginosa]MCW3917699.1 hypothetical protein [Pseudomonas aeruginosa]